MRVNRLSIAVILVDVRQYPAAAVSAQIADARLAIEAALVLATVAQRFHVDVPEPRRVVPDPSLTLRPKGGLRVQLRARTETP